VLSGTGWCSCQVTDTSVKRLTCSKSLRYSNNLGQDIIQGIRKGGVQPVAVVLETSGNTGTRSSASPNDFASRLNGATSSYCRAADSNSIAMSS
jgi:hypothetical protein